MDFIQYWPEYHRYIGSVYEALRKKRKQEEDRQRGKVLWFLANFLQAYLRRILWESAPLSIWGNQSKCKLRWQLRPQVRRDSVRVSNPIPLIIEVVELQSINAEAVENGWHIWHILALLGHWAWPQGLECGWRKASTFSIKLLKNYRV